MLNKAMIIGRLTRKPELRQTNSGKPVASFTVVTNEKWGDKEEATFHDCIAWEKTAENAAKYLDKGSLVYVEGRIQKRKYQAKDGTERTAVEVVAAVVRFLDRKGQRDEDGHRPQDEAGQSSRSERATSRPSYQPLPVSTNQRNGDHGDWTREETQRAVQERKAAAPATVEEPPPIDDDLPF